MFKKCQVASLCCSCPIRLQNSLIINISRKNSIDILVFLYGNNHQGKVAPESITYGWMWEGVLLFQSDRRILWWHGLAVYVKEGLPFAWDFSLENSVDSFLCFRLALFHSASYFFFLYRSPSLLLCTVFESISSNIDDVLSINPYADVFVIGGFNIHHKDWLSYSGETYRHVELCYNFSISNNLTHMINFSTQILTVTLTVLLFWVYFFFWR